MPETHFNAGDSVTVRGCTWNVEEVLTFPDCALLHLSRRPAGSRPIDRTFLYPFDRPVLQKRQSRVRIATPRRWMHALQAHLADRRTFGRLRSPAAAAIDILPFQLEPALAIVRGLASRLLIADEVGLGKTIQAGIILSELQQRGWCDRALIVAPAGLREQWSDELDRRFNIHAALLDATTLRDMVAVLPSGLNPWSVNQVSITSMDFVKQPEVLRSLTSLMWDLIIVDEAHQAATAPQRSAAVARLASRGRHIVLLTATPHDGTGAAYQSLCDLGAIEGDDPIVVFHRTRSEVGRGRTRRVHLLPVRLSAAETHMHRLLRDYAQRVWQIGHTHNDPSLLLVSTVLTKRALSGASCLAISVKRRLEALGASRPLHTNGVQCGLPLELDEEAADREPALMAKAFDRPEEECQALKNLLHAAQQARVGERKIAALLRLVRRVREPVIVFTEYRDTLAVLEAATGSGRRTVLLHGGLNRHERRHSVEAFSTGGADLMLATDAGSEGLNLHANCRVVVNLELPWNPVRLEQRIGRVDRLGQTRAVHAIHLFASDTPESFVLARLLHRMDRIRTEADIALEIFNDNDHRAASRR